MAELLVVQNDQKKFAENIENIIGSSSSNKIYVIPYILTRPKQYTEDHFARLVSLSGAKDVILVFADFVQRQEVNGQLEPFLGTSAANTVNPWVPLANNTIPTLGILHLKKANRLTIPSGKRLTAIIEIASRSWINGAQSSTRL